MISTMDCHFFHNISIHIRKLHQQPISITTVRVSCTVAITRYLYIIISEFHTSVFVQRFLPVRLIISVCRVIVHPGLNTEILLYCRMQVVVVVVCCCFIMETLQAEASLQGIQVNHKLLPK